MEYKRLSRCGIDSCKQTLFYLDDGQWFCKNGHLREGEIEVTADNEGIGAQGSRAGRVTQEKEKVYKILHGRKGFELFLQCYQLILRKQVWWLIHEKGFPQELEVVVRDLWALQLQKVSSTIPEAADVPREDPESPVDGASSVDYSSQSSYLYTSGDDSQASTTQSGNSRLARRRRRRRVPKAADRPRLIESVGICYLGLAVLGVAVSLGDIHRWVEEQGIVYLRAINEVPLEMKRRLGAEYWIALDPGKRPPLGLLYRTVHDIVAMYQLSFGMNFPPLNTALMAFRYIKALGLPLEIYPAVKRLANLISLKFIWQGLKPPKRVSDWPEARLMALVIVSTKLLFGLDGVPRAPKYAAEPAAIGLRWEAWEGYLREGNSEYRGLLGKDVQAAGKGLEVDVEEKDVFDMDGEELDRYMDWFEKNWADDSNTKLTRQILDLFPTDRAVADPAGSFEQPQDGNPENEDPARYNSAGERLQKLQSEIETHKSSPDGRSVIRPGDQYLWYSFKAELPIEQQILLQAAADLLAVPRDDLSKAIKFLETCFRRLVKDRRKREKGGRMDVEEI